MRLLAAVALTRATPQRGWQLSPSSATATEALIVSSRPRRLRLSAYSKIELRDCFHAVTANSELRLLLERRRPIQLKKELRIPDRCMKCSASGPGLCGDTTPRVLPRAKTDTIA
jgi:hypothetical protein